MGLFDFLRKPKPQTKVSKRVPDDHITTPALTDLPAAPPDTRLHFEHAEFVLDLAPSWTVVHGTDPDQFQFKSELLSSILTISVMSAGIPPDMMRQAADKFFEFRRHAELADSSRLVTLGDHWVTPKPDGDVIEISYAGYDNRGRIFRFMGFVTSKRVLSFYCETFSNDNEHSKGVFDKAFRGFRFFVP